MTDSKAFMDVVQNRGVPLELVAKHAKLSVKALKKRIHNQGEFKARQLQACAEILTLSADEKKRIFFARE